jgi:hypothetical protein
LTSIAHFVQIVVKIAQLFSDLVYLRKFLEIEGERPAPGGFFNMKNLRILIVPL